MGISPENVDKKNLVVSASNNFTNATPACASNSLKQSMVAVFLNGIGFNALIDSGNSKNFVSADVVRRFNFVTYPYNGTISMASSGHRSTNSKFYSCELMVNGRRYNRINLLVMSALCSDIVLGICFLHEHSSVRLKYGGSKL